MARQEAQAERKTPLFTREQAQADRRSTSRSSAAARSSRPGRRPRSPTATSPRGGELFRINCSSCHAFGGGGGALSSGKFAPSLEHVDRPATSTRRCSPARRTCRSSATTSSRRRRSATSSPTSRTCKYDQDPGGWGLGRFGPVTEGLAIFLVGMVALVFATLWIAGKS